MRTFYMPPFAAAVICSILVMGAIGFFVVCPVALINWTWNAFIAQHTVLPQIHCWQACLLYAASACIIYLSGIVQIEFKTEIPD